MGLTYEKAKSIILTVLVVISCALTWNLWTYQPVYDELENADTIQEVSFSPKKRIKEIVKPDQAMFHINGRHYGTVADQDINNILNEISKWNFKDSNDTSVDNDIISNLIQNHTVLEIIYPGSISIDLYKNMLAIKERDMAGFHFDKLIVDFDAYQKGDGSVYFISNHDRHIQKFTIPLESIAHFRNKYLVEAKHYNKYFPIRIAKNTIYLPENGTEVLSYEYLSKQLDSNKFKDALFSEPSLVQKNSTGFGEEYTDGSNLMRVDKDKNIINYIDPADSGTKVVKTDDLLKRSIDFVNDHGGWTDHYRYIGLDHDQKTVNFQLYGPDGYPVFGENTSTTLVTLVWGKTDISRYNRSNFSLGLLTNTTYKQLASGNKVIDSIKEQEDYDPDLLQDIKIGYRMNLNAESLLVELEPSWYYLYNGVWKQVFAQNMGGNNIGLE